MAAESPPTPRNAQPTGVSVSLPGRGATKTCHGAIAGYPGHMFSTTNAALDQLSLVHEPISPAVSTALRRVSEAAGAQRSALEPVFGHARIAHPAHGELPLERTLRIAR